MTTVFLDRDGVINENRDDYVKSWQEFCFLPGACEAIARLTQAGHRIVVCTNQAGIASGHLTVPIVEDIHQRMRAAVEQAGGSIAGVYYCAHGKYDGCACRKPRPGLLLQACDDLQLDRRDVVFIGDGITDIQAGFAAGFFPILVLTGRGQEQLHLSADMKIAPFLVVGDLSRATDIIVQGLHHSWQQDMHICMS